MHISYSERCIIQQQLIKCRRQQLCCFSVVGCGWCIDFVQQSANMRCDGAREVCFEIREIQCIGTKEQYLPCDRCP